MALIEALCCEWPNLWPAPPAARLDILGWLFAQLQSLLRGLYVDVRSLPALAHLDAELLRMQLRLEHSLQISLAPLQALHEQIESLNHRLQRNSAPGGAMQLLPREIGPAPLMPIMIWPTRPMLQIKPTRRRTAQWVCAAAATLVLVCGGWWILTGSDDQSRQRFTDLFQQQQPIPVPVRLDSLALFDAGSSELKPDSTKVLISALIDIKAQPGWLIVISGHSDDRGNPEQNRQLSHARASAVRGWMQRMGDIPDSCFAVQGVAASQPIASNDTESGRAVNRRVDISLVPQAGACGQSVVGSA
ncbi:OmpA family protein [Pseudomonas sp. PCH199]|uniref:OmpA family protein n=1 Tax=unclassified Pseudomonas TaxID=196821 RepID=UPI002ADDDF8B|nr:OmpA family protein [Pseudomonas sp. PCH199]